MLIILHSSIVTYSIARKELIENCYLGNILQIYPADKRACIILQPNVENAGSCKLQKGVKAALTLDQINYQMNTSINTFNFLKTQEICFECDIARDPNCASKLKDTNLVRFTIESVNQYIAPSVSTIKRQHMNLESCFFHDGIQRRNRDTRSFYQIDRNIIKFYGVLTEECSEFLPYVISASAVNLYLTYEDIAHLISIKNYSLVTEIINSISYVLVDVLTNDDLFQLLENKIITNCSVDITAKINGYDMVFYDYSTLYFGIRNQDIFQQHLIQVLKDSLLLATLQPDDNALIADANKGLQGYDLLLISIVVYPYLSDLPRPYEFTVPGNIPQFDGMGRYSMLCSDSTVKNYTICASRTQDILDTTQTDLYTVLLFKFYQKNALQDIFIFPVSQYLEPCFSQIQLSMRLSEFTFKFAKNKEASSCMIISNKTYQFEVFQSSSNGVHESLFAFSGNMTGNQSGVQYNCEKQCKQLVTQINMNPELTMIISSSDSSQYEAYSIEKIQYSDYSEVHQFAQYTLYYEISVMLLVTITVIFLSERIKKLMLIKKKAKLTLKEVDEL